MTFARILLGLTGSIFAGYGIFCLLDPAAPAGFFSLELPNSTATVEIVAMYGGLQTAMGALFLYAAADVQRVRTGTFTMAVLMGGLAIGRTYGLLVHGADTTYNLPAVAYETTSTVLALVAWTKLGSTPGRASDIVTP